MVLMSRLSLLALLSFGERLPQGAVRSAALDRSCFTAPLGVVVGPIEVCRGVRRYAETEGRTVFRSVAQSSAGHPTSWWGQESRPILL